MRQGRFATAAVAAAVALVTCLAVLTQLLQDPDTYWHVRVGQGVLQGGGLPTVDTYSWSAVGEPWIAKEWLSQVIFGAAFELGGWRAVALLAALSVAASFGLLAWFLSERLDAVRVGVLCVAAFVLAAPHLLARPHVLALPLLVVWTAVLVRCVDLGRRPPWHLMVVLVLWVNLHGSFLLGLGIALLLGLDAVVRARVDTRASTARTWSGFVAVGVLLTGTTPYGFGTLLAALDVVRLGTGLSVIVEWQPLDFSTPGPIGILLVLGVGLLLVSDFRLPWPRALLVLGLALLSLRAVRNGDVVGLTTTLLLAGPLSEHRAEWAADGSTGRAPFSLALVALTAVVAIVAAVVLPLQRDGLVPAARYRSEGAVAALSDLDVVRVLNDYNFGGYLIWVGVPTFVDGRAELHGADALVRHDAAIRADPPGMLRALLDEERIQATLLQPGTPALAYLDTSPEWEAVFADDVAVVHRRVPPAGG